MGEQIQSQCQSETTSHVVDRIVTKHEAFFRLITETSSLSRDEQLALLETAIPSAKEAA